MSGDKEVCNSSSSIWDRGSVWDQHADLSCDNLCHFSGTTRRTRPTRAAGNPWNTGDWIDHTPMTSRTTERIKCGSDVLIVICTASVIRSAETYCESLLHICSNKCTAEPPQSNSRMGCSLSFKCRKHLLQSVKLTSSESELSKRWSSPDWDFYLPLSFS